MTFILKSFYFQNEVKELSEDGTRYIQVQSPQIVADISLLPNEGTDIDDVRLGVSEMRITISPDTHVLPELPPSELEKWLVDFLKKRLG